MANIGGGTTNSTPLQYPGNTLMARRSQNGHLYVLIKASTADNYTLYRSTDNGGSWSTFVTKVRTGVGDLGSIFFDKSGWLRWVYRVNESSQDRIYISGIDVTRSSPAWETELRLGAAATGTYTGLDVWSTIAGGREYFAVAVGKVVGSAGGVEMLGAYTPTIPGTTVADSSIFGQNRQWLVDGTGRQGPSIDAQHNGDAITAGTPHLWVSFGRTTHRLVKLSWNGSGWSGPSTPLLVKSGLTARNYAPGLWDGVRHISVTISTADTQRFDLWERNQANSATVQRTPGDDHPTGNITALSLSYDSTNGNVRVFAVGTSTNVLYSITYNRVADSWGGWSSVLATALLGVDQWTRRRGTYGRSKYDIVTAHSGAPNVITHTAQSLTYAALTPAWEFDAILWRSGEAADVTVGGSTGLFLDWEHRSVDGNAQSAYALSRQIGAGALAYYRASDATWQAAEVKNVSSSTSFTPPLPWGAGTDANHTYKVKTWDAADQASAYSDPLIVIPSVKVNPTVTAPVDASTITGDSVLVTWTAAEQTAFQVDLLIFGILVSSSGKVTGTGTSYLIGPPGSVLADGFSYSIKVWTWNNEGLRSDAVQKNITIDYIEPATPAVTVAPIPLKGIIRATIANPTPGGGQPAVDHNDVYRRLASDLSGSGIRIATLVANNGIYDDWTPTSRTEYSYRVIVYGNNGTQASSAWVT